MILSHSEKVGGLLLMNCHTPQWCQLWTCDLNLAFRGLISPTPFVVLCGWLLAVLQYKWVSRRHLTHILFLPRKKPYSCFFTILTYIVYLHWWVSTTPFCFTLLSTSSILKLWQNKNDQMFVVILVFAAGSWWNLKKDMQKPSITIKDWPFLFWRGFKMTALVESTFWNPVFNFTIISQSFHNLLISCDT